MVASTHWLASAAGMAVLERGGNAFDAAVAAGLTLQVVEPHLNGPGGDLPAVFWSADRGEPLVLCAQGVAPAAATIERYRELGHEPRRAAQRHRADLNAVAPELAVVDLLAGDPVIHPAGGNGVSEHPHDVVREHLATAIRQALGNELPFVRDPVSALSKE